MSKLLRILVILLLILNICSLILGHALFRKREILKGRTQKLEEALIELAASIEKSAPILEEKPKYPERDIDITTDNIIKTPTRSDFWKNYNPELELSASNTINLADRRIELASFYKLDPATFKPMKDPFTEEYIKEGPGTMQALLNEITEKAFDQYQLLEGTRKELSIIREELVNTITEANEKKKELRLALNNITEKNSKIANLETTIVQKDMEISRHENEIADLNHTLTQNKDLIAGQTDRIRILEKENIALNGEIERITGSPMSQNWVSLTPGYKGTIASVNSHWNFVLINLDDDFIKQYNTAWKIVKREPSPELTIVRKDNDETTPITKVRLCNIYPEKNLGVATILNEWTNGEILEGDHVLY